MDEALRTKIDRLNMQALELRYTDLEGAISLCEKAADLAKSDLSSDVYYQGWGESLFNLGEFSSQSGNFHRALSYYFKSLLAYESIADRHKIAFVLYAIGNSYSNLGDFPNALEHYLTALDIARELKDRLCEATALNGIGSLYMQLGEWQKALPYLDDSLNIAETTNNLSLQAKVSEHLCSCLCQLKDYENALSCGLRSVRLCQECGDLKAEAEVLYAVGEVYLLMEDQNQAMIHFQRSLAISEAIDLKIQPIRALRSISQLYFRKGSADRAQELLHEALRRAEALDIKREQYACHQMLASAYKEMGNYEKALVHYEKFHAIKEILFNEEADLRLKTLETTFQAQKARKEAEIYQLKNVALQQEIEQRKQTQAELERMARIDPLTNIYNRRYFFHLAEAEFKRSLRYKHLLSLIMIDVDYFKHINDNFGHLIGDQVLVEIARRIQETVREVDICCRFGGEEFLVLLPETNAVSARLVAERIRQRIAGSMFNTNNGKVPVSISLGIADSVDVEKLDTVISHADAALYEAKRLGRNQVVIYDGQTVPGWNEGSKSLN